MDACGCQKVITKTKQSVNYFKKDIKLLSFTGILPKEVTMARPNGNAEVTAARRMNILLAAFEVFGKAGFRGGTLSQIAEKVGVTEAAVLHHFKTKANLLLEVLDYRDQITAKRMDLENVHPDRFVEVWLDLIKFNSSYPGIVELYSRLSAEATSPDHPAHEFFRIRYQRVTALTLSAVLHMAEVGWLRPERGPEDIARGLIALSDGLQIQWLLDKKLDMIEEHKNFFRSVLNEKGLAAVGLKPTNP